MNMITRSLIALILVVIIPASLMAHTPVSDKVRNVRKSFAFIRINIEIKPVSCTFVEGPNPESLAPKECDTKSLEPKIMRSMGSGTVVSHVVDSTYILTAAHVCSHPKKDKQTIGHKEIIVKLTPTALVRDVQGNEYMARIFALDTRNDLCILKATGIFGEPADVADRMPPLPSEIYSYGAPLGINHPGTVLFYSGFTAGSHYDNTLERTTYFYTLVIRGGSSGSSVLNNEGKIIGVVHTAVVGLQQLAISASLESVKNILSSIPKTKYERIGP